MCLWKWLGFVFFCFKSSNWLPLHTGLKLTQHCSLICFSQRPGTIRALSTLAETPQIMLVTCGAPFPSMSSAVMIAHQAGATPQTCQALCPVGLVFSPFPPPRMLFSHLTLVKTTLCTSWTSCSLCMPISSSLLPYAAFVFFRERVFSYFLTHWFVYCPTPSSDWKHLAGRNFVLFTIFWHLEEGLSNNIERHILKKNE